MLKQLIQLDCCQALPGDLVPNDNNSYGRVLPKGTVDDERLQWVHLFDDGAAHSVLVKHSSTLGA